MLSKEFATSYSLNSVSVRNIVYFYSRKERMNDLEILEKGLTEHFPASIDKYYIQLASNYLDNEKTDMAINIYTDRIKNDPKSFGSYEGLSKIYFNNGKIDKPEQRP